MFDKKKLNRAICLVFIIWVGLVVLFVITKEWSLFLLSSYALFLLLYLFMVKIKNRRDLWAETKERPKFDLSQIEGKKIRWQVVNLPFYVMVGTFVYLPYAALIWLLMEGHFDFSERLAGISEFFELLLYSVLPLLSLVLLNRFLFGHCLCVLNEEGIYYRDGFIEWKSIQKAEYDINIPSGSSICFCSLQIVTKEETVKIEHAPRLILAAIKKQAPYIPCKVNKNSKSAGIFCILLLLALPFFAPYL